MESIFRMRRQWGSLTLLVLVTTATLPFAIFAEVLDSEIHFRNSAADAPNDTDQSNATPADNRSARDHQIRRDEEERRPTTALKPLDAEVRHILDSYYLRPLSTRDETPWSILHWSIAFGIDANVRTPGSAEECASAIGWLCVNNPAAGQRLIIDRGDSFNVPVAPGLQGHEGQFLSMLAQSQVKKDYVLRVGSRELSIADLIDYEKRTCRINTELTFKLIGLCHYEGTDAAWKNSRGEDWSVTRLLKEELKQPIGAKEAACGGLHRLFSISYAAAKREKEGGEMKGEWLIAHERTIRYQKRAFELQNSDGSFSTAWLDKREERSDITRQLTTSGHILEWLANSLPDEQLRDERFQRAVAFVTSVLDGKQDTAWHRGALSHALHALAIYEQRVLGALPGARGERLANGVADAEVGDSHNSSKREVREPSELRLP